MALHALTSAAAQFFFVLALSGVALGLLGLAVGYGTYFNLHVVLVTDISFRAWHHLLGIYDILDIDQYFTWTQWHTMIAGAAIVASFGSVIGAAQHEAFVARVNAGFAEEEGQGDGEDDAITKEYKDGHPRGLLKMLFVTSLLLTVAVFRTFDLHTEDFTTPSDSLPPSFPTQGIEDWLKRAENLSPYYINWKPGEQTDLVSLLHKSAIVHAGTEGRVYASRFYKEVFGNMTRVGEALYPTMRTNGIGLNVASMLEYEHTLSDKQFRPRAYTWNISRRLKAINATAYGTNVTVSCADVTAARPVTRELLRTGNVAVNEFRIPTLESESRPSSNLTFYEVETFSGAPARVVPYVEGTYEAVQKSTKLQHTFVIIDTWAVPSLHNDSVAGWWEYIERNVVLECSYGGYDVLYPVAIVDTRDPIIIGEPIGLGDLLTNETLNLVTREIRDLLDASPVLQNHVDLVVRSNRWNRTAPVPLDYARYFENVLTDVAQGYFSVKRQRYQASIFTDTPGGIRDMQRVDEVVRIGGGGWAWVVIMAIFAVLDLFVILRTLYVGMFSYGNYMGSRRRQDGRGRALVRDGTSQSRALLPGSEGYFSGDDYDSDSEADSESATATAPGAEAKTKRPRGEAAAVNVEKPLPERPGGVGAEGVAKPPEDSS